MEGVKDEDEDEDLDQEEEKRPRPLCPSAFEHFSSGVRRCRVVLLYSDVVQTGLLHSQ